MLIFWGALLGAELRELRAWRAQSLREVAALAASHTIDEGSSALATLDVQPTAMRWFGWAQLVAGIGAALGALTLVLRRASFWLTVTAFALACLVTSTHLFTVGRAQLPTHAALR